MYLDFIVHSALSSVHVYRTTWCPSIDALMRVPLFSVSAAGPNVLSPHTAGKYRCTQSQYVVCADCDHHSDDGALFNVYLQLTDRD